MNILLWVLQVLLGLHTVVGAFWKFSHSEQSVPSLRAMPHAVWLSLGAVELLASVTLLLPPFNKRLRALAGVAAVFIAAEMFLYCGLHLASGVTNHAEMTYWLVVAAFCAVIATCRLAFVTDPRPGS